MAKKKKQIQAKLTPKPRGKIVEKPQFDDEIIFSFKYLDLHSNPKFSITGCGESYLTKLLLRFKDLSRITYNEFVSSQSSALRSHKIYWPKTTEQTWIYLSQEREPPSTGNGEQGEQLYNSIVNIQIIVSTYLVGFKKIYVCPVGTAPDAVRHYQLVPKFEGIDYQQIFKHWFDRDTADGDSVQNRSPVTA